MRFGNASTTVTGTVTPASVNTRVMPHLRPTRPMVIVKSSHRRSYDWLRLSLRQVSGLDARDPSPLESLRTLGILASAPTRSDLQIGRRILHEFAGLSSCTGRTLGGRSARYL